MKQVARRMVRSETLRQAMRVARSKHAWFGSLLC